MKNILAIMLILLVPICYADWFTNAEEVSINLKISGGFELIKDGINPAVSYVHVNQSFFPREDYRQEVKRLTTNPEAEKGDNLEYEWENPYLGKHEFLLDSDILVKNSMKEVRKKVPFPLNEVPEEALPFTVPSETVDSDNEDVFLLANSLAAGEDDLFNVVHNLAAWTKRNIQYNLSTLTATATEPASWVLENRKGVCDEITNLFIAFARSLGIPAKFVSGMAYTESELFPEKWGPHGWAEVYFPGIGWVDYDVTYGEFGYLSPGHIKLKDSIDAKGSSVGYSTLGRDVELKTQQLVMKAELKGHDGEKESGIDMEANPEKRQIGFNSYDLITAKVTNRNDYYISEGLRVYSTEEVKIEGEKEIDVVLSPGESKSLFWIISIGELDEGYQYSLPFTIVSSRNITAKGSIAASSGYAVFSKGDMELLVVSDTHKNLAANISAGCKAEKQEFYISGQNRIDCILMNRGNVMIQDINVCLDKICKKVSLGISKKGNVSFDVKEDTPGKKDRLVSISKDNIKIVESVQYKAMDEPKIEIFNISMPGEVGYNDDFSIEFAIKKASFSVPSSVTVKLEQNGMSKSWKLDRLDDERKYSIKMKGKDLRNGNNTIKINVAYKDESGKEFMSIGAAYVSLSGVSFIDNIKIAIKSLLRWVFSIYGIIILAAILIAIFIAYRRNH
ncbi:transglutaminase domain-containing protein [Candidatus Woesearchaeota archaeon]|nr:transglutaminase domain-containing protein [Candidatus Woesearchaeota archaeon]